MAVNANSSVNSNIDVSVTLNIQPANPNVFEQFAETVRTQIQAALAKEFYVDISGMKLAYGKLMKGQNIKSSVEAIRNKIAQSIGKMGDVPVTLEAMQVKVADSALANVGKNVSQQFVKAIQDSFKDVTLNLNGKSVNAKQLMETFSKQLQMIQKQADAQAQKATQARIDPSTIFTPKTGKLSQRKDIKDTVYEKYRDYLLQEAKEIEAAQNTLQNVIANSKNIKPGSTGFSQLEQAAKTQLSSIKAIRDQLLQYQVSNPKAFDPSVNSGAQELINLMLRVVGATSQAENAFANFTGQIQQVSVTSGEAIAALQQLQQGIAATQKAQTSLLTAGQSGIGSANIVKLKAEAEKELVNARSILSAERLNFSSGKYNSLSDGDIKALQSGMQMLDMAIKDTDKDMAKHIATTDVLKSKYEALLNKVNSSFAKSQRYNGVNGKALQDRFAGLTAGLNNVISQGRFDTTELSNFQNLYTKSASGLQTLNRDAQALTQKALAQANIMKSSFSELQKVFTEVGKTQPNTKSFDILEAKLKQLQGDAEAAEAKLMPLMSMLSGAYGANLPSSLQNALNTAYDKKVAVQANTNTNSVSQQIIEVVKASAQIDKAIGKLNATKSMGGSGFRNAQIDAEKLYNDLLKVKEAAKNLLGGADLKVPAFKNLDAHVFNLKNKLFELQNAFQSAASGSNALGGGFQGQQGQIASLNTQYQRLIDLMNAYSGRLTKDQRAFVGGQIDSLVSQANGDLLSGKISVSGLQTITGQFEALKEKVGNVGRESLTFGENMKKALSMFSGYFSSMMLMMQGIQQIRQMIEYTKELDHAMTELRKVTDVSEATYSKFLDSAATKSVELGATLTDVVTSTGDFARLGYDINEAFQLSEAAITLKNVGDGITDIQDASTKIISAMKGFGLEASDAMSIVDKYNVVGNNFAISSAGLAEAMERSSAALHQAGNSIEESLALAVGGNSVVQDPERVGTALKTLSLRLTKTNVELQELGEDSDGAATSMSALRDQLLALTNQKVDILDGDRYKNTYQIMKEMSEVWGEMSQMNQQGALFLMGGMHHANTLSSILQNFNDVENAYSMALNDSLNSAAIEQAKYLDSIEGRIQTFQSNMQSLASHTFSADVLKGFLGIGNDVISMFDRMAQAGMFLPTVIGGIAGALSGFKNVGLFQLTSWTKGLDAGRTTYTRYGLGMSRTNEYGNRESGWITNLNLLGGKTLNDRRTVRQYRSILKSNFGSSKLALTDKDLALVKKANQYLMQSKDSSESLSTVFGKSWKQASEDIGHTNTKLQTLSSTLNNVKENGQQAAKDVTLVPLSGNHLEQTAKGSSAIGNFVKGLGMGALNMAASFGISWLIQGAVQGIDYLMHYSENKIAEGQAIVDKYTDSVKKAEDEIKSIRSVETEFNSLATGVNDFGQNVSLSVEDYQRYQEIVSQIIASSPSLIAGYDAEGNALANKNTLLQEAIALQEKEIAIAAQERKNNAKDEYKGYQEQYKIAQEEASKVAQELDYTLTSLQERFAQVGLDFIPTDFLDSIYNAIANKEQLTEGQINDITSYLNTAVNSLLADGSPLQGLISPDEIKHAQELTQQLVALNGQIDNANQKSDEQALFFASQTEAFKKASAEEQEYINKLVANRAKVSDFKTSNSLQTMAEDMSAIFENGFDKSLLVDLDDLIDKFQLGDVEVNAFKGEIDTLTDSIVQAFATSEIKGVDGKAITAEEVRSTLGIDTAYNELERLQTKMGTLREKYGNQVDLSGIVKIDEMRSVSQTFDKLEQAFRGVEVPIDVLDRLNNVLQEAGSNRSDVLDVYNQLIDMSQKGNWDSDSLVHLFDIFDGMDVGSMNQYIAGLEKCNDVIEALGLRAESDKDKIHNLLNAFIEGDYSLQFNQLNEMFDRGQIDAQAYDAAITEVLNTLSAVSGLDFEDIFDSFLKSLDFDEVKQGLANTKQVLDDFFNADYSLRPFMVDSLSSQVRELDDLIERAKAARDVQVYFDMTMLQDNLNRSLKVSTDPVQRLAEVVETTTAALQEQSSAGRVSYETFRNLQALGPQYAATLQATNGQLLANKNMLTQVVDEEKQHSQAMLQALQTGAIKEYANATNELTEAKQKLANGEAVSDDEITALENARAQAFALADGYYVAYNALEELTGARAKLDALMSGSTVAEDFEKSFGSVGAKVADLIDLGQWGDVREYLSTIFNEVPDDIPAMKQLVKKLQGYGDNTKDILVNVAKELAEITNNSEWSGLSTINMETGSVVLFDQELKALSQQSGLTEDMIRQLFATMSSYDPNYGETGIQDTIERLREMDGALTETHNTTVANVDAIREALSGTWGDMDINRLLVQLQEMGYRLLDDKGNAVDLATEIAKVANQQVNTKLLDTGSSIDGLNQLKTKAEEAMQSCDWLKNAIVDVGKAGESGPTIDVSKMITDAREGGVSLQELQEIMLGLNGLDCKFQIDGEFVSYSQVMEELSDIDSKLVDLQGAASRFNIDIYNQNEFAGFIKQCGYSIEQLQQLRAEAEACGDYNAVMAIDVVINEQQDNSVESIILRLKGDIEATQKALDQLVEMRVGDAGAWGLSEAAETAVDMRNKLSEVQAAANQLSDTRIKLDTGTAVTNLSKLGSAASVAKSAVQGLCSWISTFNSTQLQAKTTTVTVNQRTNLSYGNDNHSTRYATGTSYAKPGLTLVNDGTPVAGSAAELILKKNTNEAYIANSGRMAMVNLNAGDVVLNAKQTHDVFSGGSDIRFQRFPTGTLPGFTSTSTSTTNKNTNKTTTTTSTKSSTSTSQAKSEAKKQAKAAADGTKEEFEKLYKELQYQRDKDVIKDAEYYHRLSGLVAQYLEGKEDLLDDYRQYDVEVYKGLQKVYEENAQKEFATLEYQLNRNLIVEKEYYAHLAELNKKYYEDKEEYIEEWRKNDLAQYNYEQSLIKKEFAELEHQYNMHLITESDYNKKRKQLSEQYYAGQEHYLDEYRAEELNWLRWEESQIEQQFKDLQTKRELDLINDTEYFNEKQKLAEKYYKDQDHYIDKWVDHQVEAYNRIKDLQKESFEQAKDTYKMWMDLGLISQADYYKKLEEDIYRAMANKLIDEKEGQNQLNSLMMDKWQAAQDQYELAKQAVVTEIEQRINELETAKAKETHPIELQIRGLEDARYELQQELDDYQWEVKVRLRPYEDEKWELERQKADIERRYDKLLNPLQWRQKDLQHQQDLLEREYDLVLRPVKRELDDLNRQKTQIEHEYEKLLKPYQDQQLALQREQSVYQHEQELTLRPIEDELEEINRLTTQINHNYEQMLYPLQQHQKLLQEEQAALEREQELALRPIEHMLNALNRETTHINRYYELLLRPYEEFQKLQQKEQAALQREQELALRPIERELDAIQRQTTHINRQYELRLRPLNDALKKLQEEKELQEQTYDLDKKRYNLAKAQAERVNRVYREGIGFVYESDKEAIREAQEALRQEYYESQIDALQKRIDKIEEERDKVIQALDDRSYDLTELRTDIQENFSRQLLVVSDYLYDVGLTIDKLTELKEDLLRPIEDRIYDLTQARTDITEKFAAHLDAIADNLYEIGLDIQRLENERDKLLKPLEDRIYDLNQARQDMAKFYEAQLRRISDALYDIELSMQSIEDKRKEIIDALEDRIYDLTEQRLNMERFYEDQLQEISDALYNVAYEIERLEYERDRLLEPIDDRLWEINRQIEDINRESDLHTRILEDQIHQYDIQIEQLNRQIELINRKYDDQIYLLNEMKQVWDNMLNPMEQAKQQAAAIAVFGEDWEKFLNMIKTDDLPSIIDQLQAANQAMADLVHQGMSSLTPDYSNPGINNPADVIGSVDGSLGINTPQSFTPAEIEALKLQASQLLNGSYRNELQAAGIFDISKLTHLMTAWENFKAGNPGSAEALEQAVNMLKEAIRLANEFIANQSSQNPSQTPSSSTPSTPSPEPGDHDSPPSDRPGGSSGDSSSSSESPAIVLMRQMLERFVNALAAGVTEIPSTVVALLKDSLRRAIEGSSAGIEMFWNLANQYTHYLNGYASGRKNGPAELAITQEKGAELLATRSGGRYTLLSPGDKVFSAMQTANLWKISQKDPNFLGDRGAKPKIQTLRNDMVNYSVSIGDVIVQHADNPDDLSAAIIRSLPNQLLQDMQRRS